MINQGELQILHIFKIPNKSPLGDSHTISDKTHSCLQDLNEKYLICARWNVWSASDEDEVQERTGDTGDGCRRGGRLSPPHTYLLDAIVRAQFSATTNRLKVLSIVMQNSRVL